MHEVIPNFPLVDARVETPKLITDVFLVLGMGELEETAFSFTFNDVAGQFMCHLLRSHDETLAQDVFLDIFQQMML